MLFHDFYAAAPGSPAISFEVFPPKNAEAEVSLRSVLPRLTALRPDFMTVTYGALGSERTRTIETVCHIQDTYGIPTACHLTCVGSSRAEIDTILTRAAECSIRNIVALRGDPPKGDAAVGFVPPADGFAYASQLVAHIRDFERRHGARFGIAVAGYPEKHIEAASLEADLANLRHKVDAGADIVITQLFYDNARYFDFVVAARAAGITVPIVPGLMPITSSRQIKTITERCGASLPADLAARLASAGDDAQAALAIGVDHCATQAAGLLAAGAPGIHFYVMNRSAHMEQILDRLAPSLK